MASLLLVGVGGGSEHRAPGLKPTPVTTQLTRQLLVETSELHTTITVAPFTRTENHSRLLKNPMFGRTFTRGTEERGGGLANQCSNMFPALFHGARNMKSGKEARTQTSRIRFSDHDNCATGASYTHGRQTSVWSLATFISTSKTLIPGEQEVALVP